MAHPPFAKRAAAFMLVLMVSLITGCQTVRTPEEEMAAMNIPRELNMTSMPTYIVEPPDLLIVEVLESLPGRPIMGEHLVRPDGTITLGYYGDIYVAGLSLPEIKEKIVLYLRNYVTDEMLGLWKANDKGEPIPVAPRDSDRVYVDVGSYNSKFYYMQGDIAATGRYPITGNETVLDAINNAGGLIPTAAPNNIRLVRPAPPGACCAQTFPVNLPAIVSAGDTTTNYQLMPGDRIVAYRDPIVRATIFLDRLAAPFQTVISSGLTTSFFIRNLQYIRAGVPATASAASATSATPTSVVQPGAR